jgi:hypothetical protein
VFARIGRVVSRLKTRLSRPGNEVNDVDGLRGGIDIGLAAAHDPFGV